MCTTSREFCAFVILAVSVLFVSETWAHRDRGPNDPCRKQLGESLLHLTLYQPQFDPDAEYCEEVPRGGKTIIVVDVTAGELRETPISFAISTADAAGQIRTVLSVPAKVYDRGVLDTEVVFNEGSDYIAQVRLELGADKGPQLLSFPIRVASWYKPMIMPALIVVALLVLTAISVVRYQLSTRREAVPEKLKVRRVTN
jgi:hypothetical protein